LCAHSEQTSDPTFLSLKIQEDTPLKLKTSSLLIAATLFGAAVMPAQASEAMEDLLKVLRDQGTITAQNYELLVNAARADKEQSDAVANKVDKVEETAEKATKSNIKVTTKGKLKIEDAEGNWSFQPIGRVMWDAVSADSDADDSSNWDGTELRRARLGFQGSIYDWGYKFEADFAKGDASVKDAYIKYGTKFGDTKAGVKLGQAHIPFGLNTKVSSKYMTFMDRPFFADSKLSPARESGAIASLAAKDYSWTLATSVTVGTVSGGYSDEDDDGTTFALRGSFVPYMQDKNHLLQIGAGYLNKSDGDEGFSFSQHLVAHKDQTKIKSGSIAAANYDGSDAFTLDAMGVYGSFHAMAEYLNYTADNTAGSDIEIDGYAVEAGYFLTGESLKWKKGYTSGITPKSSSGAWQVATRFESLDIDDGNVAGDDEAKRWTVGINYYPTQNTRLMLNYDKVVSWEQNGSDTDDEPSALKFRAQAYW